MKLSESSLLRSDLKRFKSRVSTDRKQWFPQVLSTDYLEVWNTYIKSKLCLSYPKDLRGQHTAVSLFLGMMCDKHNCKMNAAAHYDVRQQVAAIRYTLEATQLQSRLNLDWHKHEFSLSAIHDKQVKAFYDLHCTGFITYKVSGKKPLDAYLPRLAMFPKLPKQLTSTKSLRADLQIKSEDNWVELPPKSRLSVVLHMARAKYSTVIVRYSFAVPRIFVYGNQSPAQMLKDIRKRHEQAVKKL